MMSIGMNTLLVSGNSCEKVNKVNKFENLVDIAYFKQHPEVNGSIRFYLPEFAMEIFQDDMISRGCMHWSIRLFDKYLSVSADIAEDQVVLIMVACMIISLEVYEEYSDMSLTIIDRIKKKFIFDVSDEKYKLQKENIYNTLYSIFNLTDFNIIENNAMFFLLKNKIRLSLVGLDIIENNSKTNNLIQRDDFSGLVTYILTIVLFDWRSSFMDQELLFVGAIYVANLWGQNQIGWKDIISDITSLDLSDANILNKIYTMGHYLRDVIISVDNKNNREFFLYSCFPSFMKEIMSLLPHATNVYDMRLIICKEYSFKKQMNNFLCGNVIDNKKDGIDGKYVTTIRLGKGTFSEVFGCYAKNCKDKKMIAIKSQKFDNISMREISVLKYLCHPNIISILEINIDPNKQMIYFTMPLYKNTLADIIKGCKILDKHVIMFSKQLLEATKYCHQNNIIHQDIKPANIMVSNVYDKIVLADFGLARYYTDEYVDYISEITTHWYRAPEIFLGCDRYTNKIDTWSIGCVIAEMTTGTALFKDSDILDMLISIFSFCGSPHIELIESTTETELNNNKSYKYYDTVIHPKIDLDSLKNLSKKEFTLNNPNLMNLILRLVEKNPIERLDANTALKYLSE